MAEVIAIIGMKEVLRNLRWRQTALADGFNRGARIAGLMLQRASQKKVPVDFGILKNSAYTRATGRGFGTQVNVGYTVHYALYVHEAVKMKLKGQLRTVPKGEKGYRGRFWDPQGKAQAKFLEEPARTMAKELREVIQSHMKIRI